jgi:hypothetical protein
MTNEPPASGFFVGSPWSPSPGDGGAASYVGGNIEDSWRVADTFSLPRSQQQWRRSVPGPDTQIPDLGTTTQVTKSLPATSGQVLSTSLDTIPMGTMVYPDGNQWLHQLMQESPLASSGRKQAPPPAADGDSSSSDERDQCCECGHHKHHQKKSPGRTEPQGGLADRNSLSAPARPYSTGATAMTPVSMAPGTPTRGQSAYSSLMRDHGIDLAQLVPPRTTSRQHPRRDSVHGTSSIPDTGGCVSGGAAPPPPQTQVQARAWGHQPQEGLNRRISETDAFSRGTEQVDAQQVDVEDRMSWKGGHECGRYDIVRREEFVEEGHDRSGPSVTKVVVIYMQEN